MYKLATLIIVMLLFGSVSCLPIPHTTQVSPAIKGKVVDEVSGSPIQNAKIIYSRGSYSRTSTTDENGEFSVSPLSQWHYLIYVGSPGHLPPPDRLSYTFLPARLEVTLVGYYATSVKIRVENSLVKGDLPEGLKRDLAGNILLRMKPKNSEAYKGQNGLYFSQQPGTMKKHKLK